MIFVRLYGADQLFEMFDKIKKEAGEFSRDPKYSDLGIILWAPLDSDTFMVANGSDTPFTLAPFVVITHKKFSDDTRHQGVLIKDLADVMSESWALPVFVTEYSFISLHSGVTLNPEQ